MISLQPQREPRRGEHKIRVVCKCDGYPIVAIVDAIVDDRKFKREGTLTQSLQQACRRAVESWVQVQVQQTNVEKLTELRDNGDFNIGDLANEIGDGYNDSDASYPEQSDLEYHLMQQGLLCLETYTFQGTDDDDSWDHDQPLWQTPAAARM